MIEKAAILEMFVLFQFPIGASPEQCEPAISAWECNSQDQSLFVKSECQVKDLEGIQVWRNAYTGEEMISDGLREAFWGGWSIQPQTKTINNEWESIGGYFENVFYVHHWVLCTNLTDDQRQEWETYRRLKKAGFERKNKINIQEAIQLEF